MEHFPKCRALWIMGLLLICLGAVVHSHAESWAIHAYPPSVGQNAAYVDYPSKFLYEDAGISMMVLGGISFTFGLVSWVYPPRRGQP